MTDAGSGTTVLDDIVVAMLLPPRDPRGHKGTNGTLLAICGSLDYAGAALLVGVAAARAGAGLVCLAVPASLQMLFAGRVPELVTIGLPERDPGVVDPVESLRVIASRHPTAVVAGSGLRASPAVIELVSLLVAEGSLDDGVPLVCDAEALNSLALSPGWWQRVARPCVLTPHPGEFRRLRPSVDGDLSSDDELRGRAAAAAAREWRSTVVLKGARTVIATPDGRLAQVPFENAALATAGTGDVLAGTIGGLLAQGLEPWAAASAGAYLHGVAAERISERLGDAGLLASDLPWEIALARRRLGEVRDLQAKRGAFGFAQRQS